MRLQIKNPEARELAARLSRLTGKSMTTVVIEALRFQLSQQQRTQKQHVLCNELMAIGARCAAHIYDPTHATAHGDFLYEENGMPE